MEGAFVQGLGYLTSEEVVVDTETGKLISDGTWTYKIPSAACIPQKMNVEFLKVTSFVVEPLICVTILFALYLNGEKDLQVICLVLWASAFPASSRRKSLSFDKQLTSTVLIVLCLVLLLH